MYFAKSCWVGVALGFTTFFGGCTPSQDELLAYSRMRQVWVAMRDYEKLNGKLPTANDNQWRFSDTTRFHAVPWRGLLLDRVAAIPSANEQEQIERVENLIDEVGEEAFTFNGDLVYSNLDSISSISNAPKYQAIAFTVCSKSPVKWNAEETESMEEILAGHGSWQIPINGCFVLFACGNVGRIDYEERHILMKLRKPSTLDGNSREWVCGLGVEILDPMRIDFRE